MFKKCKVVMLSSHKAENSIIFYQDRTLSCTPGYFTREYLSSINANAYHLYILSDDKVVDNDWILPNNLENPFNRHPYMFKKAPCPLPYWGAENTCSKIIATTNKDLNLPFPSVAFLEKFCEYHNKGGIINEILVEYQEDWNSETIACMEGYGDNPENFPFVPKPKVDSKDNTITIRKIKDIWNRDEVEDLLWKAMKEVGYVSVEDFQHFIKENL